MDLIGVGYAFPFLMRCACIYSACSFTGNLVYTYKLTQCEQLIQNTLRNSRRSSGSKKTNWPKMSIINFVKNFEHFYFEHTRICAHILYGDDKIWSKIMFCFLTTNVPANCYFLTHLLFDNLPLFDSMFFWVFLIVQIFAAVFVLLRLAKNSKLIHRFHWYIPAIQQLINGQQPQFMHVKLKFDDLLHRLNTTKYGMTVGPLFLITYESVLKVFVCYFFNNCQILCFDIFLDFSHLCLFFNVCISI